MKLMKKYPFALLLSLLAIVVSVVLGQAKHREALNSLPSSSGVTPPSLSQSIDATPFEDYILDSAGILSPEAIRQLSVYNANWDKSYGTIVAVATLDSGNSQDISALAEDYAEQVGLSMGDGLLLLVPEESVAYLTGGSAFLPSWSSSDFDRFLSSTAQSLFESGHYEEAALATFAGLHTQLAQPAGSHGNVGSAPLASVAKIAGYLSLASVTIVLMVLFAILSILDNIRFSRYYRRYGGMPIPPILFRPILFWHGPRSRWFTRRYHRPPPPPSGGGFGGSSRSGFGRR